LPTVEQSETRIKSFLYEPETGRIAAQLILRCSQIWNVLESWKLDDL